MRAESREAVRAGLLLDRVERELGDFSYIVSHDIAAEIRHLSQFSQLLLDDARAALTDSQKELAGQIREASERCYLMMEQLLVYSRLQQRPLVFKSHEGRHLVETALLQLSAEVRAAGADVKIGPLGVVDGDGEALTLAFRHLLDNALKFRKPDAPCSVLVRALLVQGGIALEFRDNGIGLPREGREKAFRMFARLQPEGTYPGIGAGLAICRRIAHRHGGDVQFVDSDGGACVRLTLPMQPAA